MSQPKGQPILVLCVALFSLYVGMGCNYVTITGPQEGAYLDSTSVNVSVNYTGNAGYLRVYLNDSDVTSHLTIAGGTAFGEITGSQEGINEIKATLQAAIDSSYFIYYNGAIAG